MASPHILSLTRIQLADYLAGTADVCRAPHPEKRAAMRARQIFNWLYQRGARSYTEMTDLSQELRSWLTDAAPFPILTAEKRLQAGDGTLKQLWSLHDGRSIESVLMPHKALESNDWTLCLSSQVGCAMACDFCLTGRQGLARNLSTAEIIAQVVENQRVAHDTSGGDIDRVVFMGMGEPLHNLDAVIDACNILTDPQGMNFSNRKITVSTSGMVPGIDRLAADTKVKLAISLNATTDTQRTAIMPINKKWGLRQLIEACRAYPAHTFRRITFEYVLLHGFNDTMNDAERLVRLISGIPATVNLIPFNAYPGCTYRSPTEAAVTQFHQHLVSQKVPATVRRSKGQDILAACGQLYSGSNPPLMGGVR